MDKVTQLISPETVAAIQNALLPVAEKIGETAEWGWLVVVRQMYVEAWLGVMWAVSGIVIVILLLSVWIPFCMRMHKAAKLRVNSRSYDDGWLGGAIIPTLFLGILGLVFFFSGATTAITHFLNPEFYAIEFFLGS